MKKIGKKVDQQTQRLEKMLEMIIKNDVHENKQSETTTVAAPITTFEEK